MKKASVIIALVVLLSSILIAPADSQQVSFAGVVYGTNGVGSTPLPGLQVFLYTPTGGWIGPSVTDPYGRYAFFNAPQGQYVLRIYNQYGVVVWNEAVFVPSGIAHTVVIRI